MVEYALKLDFIFGSLADPTRRDILRRVAKKQLSVKELARAYEISFAGVSKHLMVLQKAGLVIKQRQGKEQLVRVNPAALKSADDYLCRYRELWEERFSRLDEVLKLEKEKMIKELLNPK